MFGYSIAGFSLVIVYQVLLTQAQVPPRLNIPGAVLLQPSRAQPQQRAHRLHNPSQDASPVPVRLRRPIPNALPISIPIREDVEEERPSILDDEVARLSIAAIQAARAPENEPEPIKPLQFRPERPLPILRQDLRESPPPRPALRQDQDDEQQYTVQRQQPPPHRQPVQQVRHHNPPPQQQQQQVRQQKPRVQAQARPQYLDGDDERRVRNKKPPVQILRKYRTDNEDGSITWGFENEDGTFKEENIGIDCVIRGKYGYIDPEGTRREYNYEAGNKCDPLEEEYPLEELPPQQILSSRPSSKKQYNVPIKA